jgi:hypothetical protein
MLEIYMFEEMKPSCRENRRQLLPNFRDVSNCLGLLGNPCSQQIRDQGQAAELQKQHRSIKRFGNRPLRRELVI